MKKDTQSATPHTGYILGRRNFAKISAIEGIALTKDMRAEFEDFDKKNLSAETRREILIKKYSVSR